MAYKWILITINTGWKCLTVLSIYFPLSQTSSLCNGASVTTPGLTTKPCARGLCVSVRGLAEIKRTGESWWRHQMETFSALLALCAGNSPTRSFDIFFRLCLNKRLSKQSRCWWFDTPSRSLWRHCDVKWFLPPVQVLRSIIKVTWDGEQLRCPFQMAFTMFTNKSLWLVISWYHRRLSP